MDERHLQWRGMNWVRPSTRLAIYLRDGLACVYCEGTIENGANRLELDHFRPHSRGGSNSPGNLLTSCQHCNAARRACSVASFARIVAAATNRDAEEILRHIAACRRRVLPRAEARAMLARRGTVKAAVALIQTQ